MWVVDLFLMHLHVHVIWMYLANARVHAQASIAASSIAFNLLTQTSASAEFTATEKVPEVTEDGNKLIYYVFFLSLKLST